MIEYLKAVLAVYRLTNLITDDDGPLFIFDRLRTYTSLRADEEKIWLTEMQEAGARLDPNKGLWASIDDGVNCPYCCGIYAGLLVVILSYLAKRNRAAKLFLEWMALSGGQSLIQRSIETLAQRK